MPDFACCTNPPGGIVVEPNDPAERTSAAKRAADPGDMASCASSLPAVAFRISISTKAMRRRMPG